MTKRIKLLALLLGAQLLLAAGLSFSRTNLAGSSTTAPLLTIDKARIDRITLEGPDKAKVVLANKNGAWTLPEAQDFPADGTRVSQLLDKLAGLKGGDVVATSTAAHTRFKVDDDAFERRITLAAGDKPQAVLYLGTSPGLRRMHARIKGKGDVRIVQLAEYDIPVEATDWQDKNLLTLPQPDIAAIALDGLRIERTVNTGGSGKKGAAPSPAWSANPIEPGKRLKPDAADMLARQLANLRFNEVLGTESKPEYGLEKPVLSLTLTRKGGKTVDYRLGKEQDKDEYILKVSSRPEYFRLASWTAKPLLDAAKPEALFETVKTESKRTKAGPSAS